MCSKRNWTINFTDRNLRKKRSRRRVTITSKNRVTKALLKYIRDEACAEEGFFTSKQVLFERASRGLEVLVKIFNVALQETDRLGVTVDCVMNVMEAAVIWTKEWQDELEEEGYDLNK